MVSTIRGADIQGRHYLPYLLLKAVPSDDGYASTLVALGIESGNRASVLMTRTVAEADTTAWLSFLSRLEQRCPAATSVRLVVIDGLPALSNAVERIWPEARRQVCWFHALRKLWLLLDSTGCSLVTSPEPRRRGCLALRSEAACLAGAWAIPEAPSHADAVQAYRRWADRWQAQFPAAVRLIQDDLPLLLAFLTEPAAVRGAIRSIDGLSWSDGVAPAAVESPNFAQDRKFPARLASI